MEPHGDRQESVTRLFVCVIIALVLYYGGERFCTAAKLPLWEQHRPWLEENRIQAIAIVAAILFGVSLAVLPLEKPHPAPSPYVPCEEAEAPL